MHFWTFQKHFSHYTIIFVPFQIPANGKNHTSPPSSGLSDIGRERVKTFTYDYSYWSVNPTDRNFASQEKVGINFIPLQEFADRVHVSNHWTLVQALAHTLVHYDMP